MNSSTMNWTADDQGEELAVVRVVGRVDITSAAELKRALAGTVSEDHRRLVLDLEGVTFIDSSGLSALVSGLRSARQAGGDLRVAAAGAQPTSVFTLTSLDKIFRLYPSVQEAIDGYRT